ncbi:hypothetical protein [Chryseobacterium indologenes]|uniref:hypothetical protein n=1 Tax=Chryseobacterium indologenes TaxID=253 RepID=UPI001892DD3A|nr:hypothetical protein [Chryseobacterium indologenes]MBF6643573.1 hypothetical protein [Chryseobacterium indologenes]
MEYYDETGKLIDDEDLLIQMLISSSYDSNDVDNVIIDFHSVKHIYDLLIEDEGSLDKDSILEINDELYGIKTTYKEKLEIWERYKQSPLIEHLISFKDRTTKAHINVFPERNQIEKYLEYTSKWVYNKLKNKREEISIYTYEDYKSDYDRKFSNLENINKEIERVQENIQSTVGKYDLNRKLNDYSNYFGDLTIDVSFFNLKDKDKIENIFAIAIGIGLLYGSYQYLSFLNSKKRNLEELPRYRLKSNQSYWSDYSDKELEIIYNDLINGEFIEKMDSMDFINIFRETKFKDVRPILWKKMSSRWLSILTLIELLVKPDYSDEKQFRIALGNCFCFKKDSNIVEDVGKSLKTPLEKIRDEHFLNPDIKRIVESNK